MTWTAVAFVEEHTTLTDTHEVQTSVITYRLHNTPDFAVI